MPTAITAADQDAIVSEIEIAAPPGRVFQALTDSAQLKRWFGSSECLPKSWKMDARLGGRYGYTTEKDMVSVNDVSEFECHGEIIEFDPPRVLAYTWMGNWHDDITHRTVVRWELTPTSNGTRVKVIHSGLLQEPASRKDYSNGWPGVLESLKKFTEARLQSSV
jgi:uncharacterized protein YndB with AHSA1/START domain